MEVNAVNTGASTVSNYVSPAATNNETTTTAAATNAAATNATAEDTTQTNEAAVYESTGSASKTYKPDTNKIKLMLEESERQVSNFQKLIQSLVNKQAQKANAAGTTDSTPAAAVKGLKELIGQLEVDDETRAKAQAEIAEGGYYSVDETAKRILDFAVALSGGDPAKIETLKKAVQDGFGAAAKEWGSDLPDISQKTYEAVMNGFDEWEKAGSASAITLLNK